MRIEYRGNVLILDDEHPNVAKIWHLTTAAAVDTIPEPLEYIKVLRPQADWGMCWPFLKVNAKKFLQFIWEHDDPVPLEVILEHLGINGKAFGAYLGNSTIHLKKLNVLQPWLVTVMKGKKVYFKNSAAYKTPPPSKL